MQTALLNEEYQIQECDLNFQFYMNNQVQYIDILQRNAKKTFKEHREQALIPARLAALTPAQAHRAISPVTTAWSTQTTKRSKF